METRWLNLCVIRGFLGFFRQSRSRFTLLCLLGGLPVSLLEYFVKIERDLRVDRFPFESDNMAKIYEYSLSTIIPHGEKTGTRSISEVKPFRGTIVLGWLTF